MAPAAAALSTARRTGMNNTIPRGVVVSQSEQPMMKMSNVRGDAFGLGNIGKKIKEDGFSYKTAFKKAYLTGEWRMGLEGIFGCVDKPLKYPCIGFSH